MAGMVGALNASEAVCCFANNLANGLADAGSSIVSGLAKGIDTASHQAWLGTATIAVIVGGSDIFYPAKNQEIQRAIAEHGFLLAEQPLRTESRARHFPYRNRIIVGLAKGKLVIEAAPRSGSLITARLAAEAGRQVMAVPGSPLDPRSRGCNMLFRDGATLVQSVDDILELIGHFDDRAESTNRGHELRANRESAPIRETRQTDIDSSERVPVINLLRVSPVTVDEIVRQSGLPPPSLQLALLELELAGRLSHHAGAGVSLLN